MLQQNLLQEYDIYVPMTTQSNNHNYLGVKIIKSPFLLKSMEWRVGKEKIDMLLPGHEDRMRLLLARYIPCQTHMTADSCSNGN